MKPVTTAIEFFGADELKCKGSGIIKLDPRFAVALPELRRAWGKPLTANSVCRTPEHNKKVGGQPSSLHLTDNPKWPSLGTMAIDVGWRDWSRETRIAFCKLAWSMGWSIGLHNSFVHLDRRADLGVAGLNQAIFLYGEWSGAFNREQIV
jgi:zinc D-Ala-D-Ala carboxypeptidase